MTMKTKLILFMVIALLLGGVGCEREKINENCYEGKILYLSEECFNIIEITVAPKDGVPVGHTISFNPDLFNKKLKEGAIVHIEITNFREWDYPIASPCVYPTYFGFVKPCKH